MFGILHFSAGPGDDQSPLRRRMRRADCRPRSGISRKAFPQKRMPRSASACDFELDQLVEIRDVTKDVSARWPAKLATMPTRRCMPSEAELQQSCGSDKSVRCDVVSLYHGGIYDLYRYKRYNDVRLVFAPEFSVAQFGGDPDNFNFPRFDFDIGVVRAYEDGKPASTSAIICTGAQTAPKTANWFSLPATQVAPAAA
jgi:hypothetical protein